MAPLIVEQELPTSLQRDHAYVYVGVDWYVQVPIDAVSVCPTWAVPLIVGGDVLLGA